MSGAVQACALGLASAAAVRRRRSFAARRSCAAAAGEPGDDALVSRDYPALSAERLRSAALERELVGQKAAFARLQSDAEEMGQRLLDSLAAAERGRREAAALRDQLECARAEAVEQAGGVAALREASQELARLRAERDEARARADKLARSAVEAWEAAHAERGRLLQAEAARDDARSLLARLQPPQPPRAAAEAAAQRTEGPSEEALARLRRRNLKPRALLPDEDAPW